MLRRNGDPRAAAPWGPRRAIGSFDAIVPKIECDRTGRLEVSSAGNGQAEGERSHRVNECTGQKPSGSEGQRNQGREAFVGFTLTKMGKPRELI